LFLIVFKSSDLISQFSPTDISGLSLWLKSDAGITESGGMVTSWADQSPNGYLFQPPIAADQPQYLPSSSLNGEPVIVFDGTDRLLSQNNFSFGNATIFVVFSQNSGDANYGRLIDHAYNFGFWIGREVGSKVGGGFIEVNAPYGNFSNLQNDRPSIITLSRIGNATSSFLNTIPFTTPSRITSGAATTNNKIAIGGTIDGIAYGKKNVYEIIIYNQSLTTTQKSQVEDYLRVKFTSPINLGSDITSTSFCSIPLAPTGTFYNYLWSTGETSSTINISESGTYWVTGTDAFGFQTTDSINVTFPQIPGPGVSAICAGQSVTWNADMGPGWTYLWSTGETTPSITFSTPGTYSVAVTDPFGCSKTSDPAIFGIDNYESTAFLGNDTSLCSGNQVALQIGGLETLEYYWNGDMSAGQQASYVVTTTGEVTLESVNVNGCVAQDTIQVTVSGIAPSADFSFTNLCGTETGAFTDLSLPAGTDPIATWSWDMGDLTTLNTQDVSYSYASPGTYIVQLYVESVGGCGDLHIETVQVFDPPVSSFTVSGHCEDQQVDFVSTSTVGGAAINTWSWNFDMPASGAYNFSAIPVPNRIFPDPATYDVSLVVTDANGCNDSLAVPVVIDPSPTVDFTNSLSCAGSMIQLTDQSTTLPGSSYTWTWPSGGSILQNPSVAFGATGSYAVTLEVGNSFGCTASLTKNITVHPLPLMTLDFGPYCAGTYMDATALTSIPTGMITSVQWIFEANDTLVGQAVSYLITDLGQLEIQATAFSDQGCSTTVLQNLDITSELNVAFTPVNGIAGAGDLFQFNNTSIGTNVALWNFGDGQFSSVFDATHIYGEQYIDSIMNVYLIGLNSEGCMDTAYGQVSVQRPYLDLALEEVFAQADGEWQIVGVRMRNTGTVNVAMADLWIETRAGRLVEETWTGMLTPGEDSIYVFSGKVQSFVSTQDAQDDFICVSGLGYNIADQPETDLSNNTTCKDLEGDNTVLLPVYPNPAQDEMHLNLLVSKEETLSLYLTDAIGQIVISALDDQVLTKGLYSYTLDLRTLREGVYFVRMRSAGGQDVSEKVVVR
jgi:PKD repeat protein